jgi:hypothetical protein
MRIGSLVGLAGGAEPPEGDLSFVEDEAVGVGWGEAGSAADGAVDIGGEPTTATDNMVVVVANPQLVEGHTAGRLDAPGYPGVDQGGQHVVDGLGGYRPQLLGDHGSDRFGFGVRSTPQGP